MTTSSFISAYLRLVCQIGYVAGANETFPSREVTHVLEYSLVKHVDHLPI